MKDMIYVDAVATRPGSDWNAVAVSVSHDKRRGIVTADGYPAKRKPNGIVQIGMVMGESYSHRLCDMPRLNRKKVEVWLGIVQCQIGLRDGAAWDLVNRVLAGQGLALKGD